MVKFLNLSVLAQSPRDGSAMAYFGGRNVRVNVNHIVAYGDHPTRDDCAQLVLSTGEVYSVMHTTRNIDMALDAQPTVV